MPRYAAAQPAARRAPARKAPVRKAAPVRRAAPARRVAAPVKRAPARKSGGSALGTAIGSALGLALGGPGGAGIGGMLGNAGGQMLSSIFGHGDYQVTNVPQIKENSIALANANNIPQFGTGRVAVKFQHREFLGDVISSATAGAFKIDSYDINPGLSKTFPWLSQVVGASFQQHRINGCTFEFRSMSSDALNSTNTALGSVIMATDYDSADITFTSKQQMENTEYGVSCKPSVNMMHAIECARSQTPVSELYIRAYASRPNTDIRLYDLGRFSIASTGLQGTNVNLGELWVTYDIDAFKAIEQVPAYLTPYAQYQLTTASATAPLGVSQAIYPVPNGADLIGLTLTENKISWPISIELGSIFQVQLSCLANEAKACTLPAVTTGNGMFVNIHTAWTVPYTAATTDSFIVTLDVQYQGGATPAALPYVNFADYTWAVASMAQADLYVRQENGYFGGTYTGTTALPMLRDTAPGYITVHQEEEKRSHPRFRVR